MADEIYTLGLWRVKPGREEEFVVAWQEMGKLFRGLPAAPSGSGTLLQSLSDPSLYYSFGAWDSLQAVQAMRQDQTIQAAMAGVRELCTEAAPGSFRVVARA